jgi:hypothetical protein
VLQVTPNATSPSFKTANTNITGATQTLNATPPAILIPWSLPPGPAISAYSDAEIGGTLVPGSEYFNTTSLVTRVWNGSAWSNQGSGGSTPSSGAGTITPLNPVYAGGAHFDTHTSGQPTFTSGSNVVTCPDCNFTGTDSQNRPMAKVGQVIFGSNATTDVSEQTSILVTPECLIQSIDSATQVHMGTVGAIGTACNATGNTTATGRIVWGDLDTATSTQTQSTSNDPMFAAWTDSTVQCLPLVLPGGIGLIERAFGNTYDTTKLCGTNAPVLSNRLGFTVVGQGGQASILIVTPNFPTTDCVGPNGAGFGCLLSANQLNMRHFQVWGAGNSLPGSGFNGKALISMTGRAPGTNIIFDDLMLMGWGAQQTGLEGVNMGGGIANGISQIWGSNTVIENFGNLDLYIDTGYDQTVQVSQFNNLTVAGLGVAQSLVVNSGAFTCTACAWSFGGGGGGNGLGSMVIQNGAKWTDIGGFTPNATGGGTGFPVWFVTGSASEPSTLVLDGETLLTQTCANIGASTNNGAILHIRGSKLTNAGCAQNGVDAVGTTSSIFDDGGNQISGMNSAAFAAVLYGDASITGSPLVTGNIALSAGFGTTTKSAISGNTKSGLFTLTAGGTLTANPTITITFPTPFYLVPNGGCSLSQVGGTNFTDLTNSATPPSVSATSVVFTLAGTAVSTHVYNYRFSCSNP